MASEQGSRWRGRPDFAHRTLTIQATTPQGRARVENGSSDGSYAPALLMFKSRMFCSILGFYPLHGKSLPNTTKLPGTEKQCSREICWITAGSLQRAPPAYSVKFWVEEATGKKAMAAASTVCHPIINGSMVKVPHILRCLSQF